MRSERQKSLIRMQKEDEEEGGLGGLEIKDTKVRVGDRVEFLDTPEYNGIVFEVSKDQWKMIKIDYNCPGHAKILSPSEMQALLKKGKVNIIKKVKTKELNGLSEE